MTSSPIPSRGAPTREALIEALSRKPMAAVASLDGSVKMPLVCLTVEERDAILALFPVEAANGSGSYEDLKVAYWTLHAALQEVTAMCPAADPGPAKNEMGHWNDEGNADDIAYACRDEALWRVKEVADHALFQGRVLADHEPAASPPLAEGQDGKGGAE